MKKEWEEIVDNMKKDIQQDYTKSLLGKTPLYDDFLEYFEKHAVPMIIELVKNMNIKKVKLKSIKITFLNGMLNYILGLEQKIVSAKEVTNLVNTKMNVGLKKDKFVNWVKIYDRGEDIIVVTAKEDGQYIFYWDFKNKKWLLIGKSVEEELSTIELDEIVKIINKYENHKYLPLCNFWELAKRKIREEKNEQNIKQDK